MKAAEVLDITRSELAHAMGSTSRANQLFRDVYQKGDFNLPCVAAKFESSDGTQRYILQLDDGEMIESVLIPEDGRMTFCISSQVGCALACTFCLTGQMGLIRNLS